MRNQDRNVFHYWNDTQFTLSPVKEVTEMEDAMTIYSDLMSDQDTPVKIPSFGPKPKLPTSSAQAPTNTFKANLITQASSTKQSGSFSGAQRLLTNLDS